jgi:hypothetical protein
VSAFSVGVIVASAMVMTRSAAYAGPLDVVRPGFGYVWADQPSTAIGVSYAPSARYQYNSSGAINTAVRLATGQYVVRFPHIGPFGTALVTPYGGAGSGAFCNIKPWGPAPDSNDDTLVEVICRNAAGDPSDSRFTMSYTQPGTGVLSTPGAFVWNDRTSEPFNMPYTPNLHYQFNSTGAINTITRWAIGHYRVRIPGFDSLPPGVVHINAYGGGKVWCTKDLDDAPPGGGIHSIEVVCQAADGSLVDSKFVATYVTQGNVLMASTTQHPSAYLQTWCWAQNPPACDRIVRWYSSSGGEATMTRFEVGKYLFNIPLDLSGGTVHVTSWFSRGHHCRVASWALDQIVVHCIDTSGDPVDSELALTFVR